MTTALTAAPAGSCLPARHHATAVRIAEAMPARGGRPWTVRAGSAWWTTRPTAHLTQGARTLLIAFGPWDTAVGWQSSDREPYEPDARLQSINPENIARETLRLVLPDADDHAAARLEPESGARSRLATLNEVGERARSHGAVTHHHLGMLPNSHVMAWTSRTSGVRYAVTLTGTNPVAEIALSGPNVAIARVLPRFLDLPPQGDVGRAELHDVTGRMQRRMASHLRDFTSVLQEDDGSLTIGRARGPYGTIAAPTDPHSRVRDDSPAAAVLHSVGTDFLLTLLPHIAP